MRDEAPPGWRVIERAGNDIDARLIAGHLEEAGISVVFEKDKSGYGDYLYGGANPNAPVTLVVPADQWEAATAVLDGASVDLTAGSEAGRNGPGDDADDDDGVVARTDEDPFYVRDRRTDDPVLAAPARSGLRWLLIALIILIVVIAAAESGFFSDLIGV